MDKVNSKVQLYIKLSLFLLVLFLLVTVFHTEGDIGFEDFVHQLPKAIAIYAVSAYVFHRWLWKLDIFKGWLVTIPYLQGTWKGVLQSNWKNPETGEGVGEIPIYLVIKQSFKKIECSIFTKESSSYSLSADIDEIQGNTQLSYTYTNTPKSSFRERSEIHNGAALLKIIKGEQMKLSGEYWTDRQTIGEIQLSFLGADLVQEFVED
jgi:hypothetical protein